VALAYSLESQFLPVEDPSDLTVIEMVNEAMRAFEYASASELILTSPSEILSDNKGFSFVKA
jgi:hypothetical protein